MRKLELYLYLFLTAAVWVTPTFLQYILGYSGQFVAKAIALPFLAWIALSAYYLLRWSYHRLQVHTHSAAAKA